MFISVPENLASFRDVLLYDYSQSSSEDLIFEIELGGGAESFEVKKLYGVRSASMNIAPIVANRYLPVPTTSAEIFATPDCGYGEVVMKCGDEESEMRYFVASKVGLPQRGVVSSLPTSRFVSYGEVDEIWLCVDSAEEVVANLVVSDDGGESSYTYTCEAEGCGLLRFKFDSTLYGLYAKMVKITFEIGGEHFAEASYYYITRPKGSVRMAWIGQSGAIECYTFPVVNSSVLYKDGSQQIEVESAYEPSGVISSLSDMLCSPRVWVMDYGDIIEVEMLSESVDLRTNGELSTITYKIVRYD